MMWIALICGVVFIIYWKLSRLFSFWDSKGVPGPKPFFLIGNMYYNILGTKSFGELCVEWYKEFKGVPLLGVYNFTKPFLVVQDVDYVETVLIKEFSHFMDRAPEPPSKVNLSDQFLFIATGSTWKALRTKLTPVFSSGKLKGMVGEMSRCFDSASRRIDSVSSRGEDVNADDFVQTYIIDATAKIVFGMDSSTIAENDSEFRRMSRKMFQFNLKRFVSFVLYFIYPKLAGLLRIPFVPTEQTEYFHALLNEAFRQRTASGLRRNDVVQLLLEMKEKGRVEVDTWEEQEDDSHLYRTTQTVELSDEMLTSQAMIFLTTGFDTMSTAIIFTLVEMCSNPETMDRATAEVKSVLEKHNHFTYEALKDMEYLERCIMEGMRLHPAIPAYLRHCTKTFRFPCGQVVSRGQTLVIPILALHMDPRLFSQPHLFRPDRYLTPPRPGSYLPFGNGPRICIARRFAMLEMKMVLARLLHAYKVELSAKTLLPVSTEKWNFLDKPNSPVYFKMTKYQPKT